MIHQYLNLEALLRAGASGDKATFRAELDEALRAAEAANDDVSARFIESVSVGGEKGIVEDKTDLSQKAAAFDRKLESEDDIPVGLSMLKTNAHMDHVILPEHVKKILFDFLNEQKNNQKYLDAGLDPRNKALLFGPPGNGKTQVTKALANYMGCPLYMVRYDALISQKPGETSKRLRAVFDFAKTHRCILFFDEIDSIGKERDDPNETGEMKRVVSMLLVQLDDVPPHVMVIGATNHARMLDRAILRRFHIRVVLPAPTPDEFEKYLRMAYEKYGHSPYKDVTHRNEVRILGIRLQPENFADTEVFVEDCHRTWIRHDKSITIEEAIKEAIANWSDTRTKVPK
jgi:SpoVK/Ycf46/Vps4 family AAA+-type ATPase